MNFIEASLLPQEVQLKALLSKVGILDIGICIGYRGNRAKVRSFRTGTGKPEEWDVELLALGSSGAGIENDPMGSFILVFTLRTSLKDLSMGLQGVEPGPFSSSALKGIVVYPYNSNKDVVVGSSNNEWRIQSLGYKVTYSKEGWCVTTPHTRINVMSAYSQVSTMQDKINVLSNDDGITCTRIDEEGKIINRTIISPDGKTSIWKHSKEKINPADEKDDDVWLEKEERDEVGNIEISRFNEDGKLIKKSVYNIDGSEAIEWYDGNNNIIKKTTVDNQGNSNSETGKDGENNITTFIDPDGNVTIESKGNGSITFEKDMTVTIKGNVTIKVEGNCDIKANGNATVSSPEVKITGGTLQVDGTSSPIGSGPFCGLPACLFTGSPHTGNTVTGT